jgi:cathepsin L
LRSLEGFSSIKMRQVATLALAVVLVSMVAGAKPKWNELESYTFDMYRRDFKKAYNPSHEGFETRKAHFEANIKHIKHLNADPTRTWKAGVNMFTDMHPKEFRRYNKFRQADKSVRANPVRVHQAPAASEPPLPITVDWREANAPRVLTAVKHQGSCGSCWAHSAAETMESQYAFLTGMLPVLSVGQINSCTPNYPPYNSAGCDGGDYGGAWAYLSNQSVSRPEVLKSVTENWAYPIPLKDWFFSDQLPNYTTSACLDVSTEWKTPATSWFAELTQVGVSGIATVNSNNATGGPAAQKALRDVGPMSISVAAGNWQWYETGVMNNTASGGGDNEWAIDHAVQLVGYGYDKGYDANYWVVRNSWSTLWGEDGFIRLWRAKAGQPEPCSPAEYGPVCGTSGLLNDIQYPIVYEATPTKFG